MNEAYEPKIQEIHENTWKIPNLPHVLKLLLQPALHSACCVSRKTIETMMKFSNQYAKVELSQMSHEKRAPGWLGYIGDDILPSYIGIIINHYKDPY